MQGLVDIIVGILLPILPAYLLFKTLPADAAVEGPWNGLKIKLGGAFGGYFLLVLIVFGYFYWLNDRRFKNEDVSHIQSESREIKVYTIKGDWKVEGESLDPGELACLQLVINPETSKVYSSGSFEAQIPVRPKQDGTPDFPYIEIKCPSGSTKDAIVGDQVDLDNKDVAAPDPTNKEVKLKSPLVIRKIAKTYLPEQAQAPQKVDQ